MNLKSVSNKRVFKCTLILLILFFILTGGLSFNKGWYKDFFIRVIDDPQHWFPISKKRFNEIKDDIFNNGSKYLCVGYLLDMDRNYHIWGVTKDNKLYDKICNPAVDKACISRKFFVCYDNNKNRVFYKPEHFIQKKIVKSIESYFWE